MYPIKTNDVTPDATPAFATAALHADADMTPTPARQPDDFDPSGLYQLEIERDFAASLLLARVPDRYSVGMYRTECLHRHEGLGVNRTARWSVYVVLDGTDRIQAEADTPTQAVDVAVAEYARYARDRAAAVASMSDDALDAVLASDHPGIGRLLDAVTAA